MTSRGLGYPESITHRVSKAVCIVKNVTTK